MVAGLADAEKLRSEFISYFGDEIVIVPGEKLAETMEGFFVNHTERTKSRLPESEKPKYESIRPPAFPVPEELAGADTVGIIFDETEGLNFFSNFQLFAAPFENPGLIKDEVYREAIMGYLWSDSISPLPFRKMVEKHPENAREVFATLFNKKTWDNEKDFFTLMKKYKGAFLKRKAKPAVIPTSQKIFPAKPVMEMKAKNPV